MPRESECGGTGDSRVGVTAEGMDQETKFRRQLMKAES